MIPFRFPGALIACFAVCLIMAGCSAAPVQSASNDTVSTIQQDSSAGAAQTPQAQSDNTQPEMILSSSGINGGVIADKYGMRGSQKDGSTPTLSIPISIENAPEDAVCFALRMIDSDSQPLSGFEWVHWTAVDIMTPNLPENASIDMASEMVQGMNDFDAIGYGGPTPPDKPHTYIITVYALDGETGLQNGFAKDAFDPAISGHVLAEAQIEGVY